MTCFVDTSHRTAESKCKSSQQLVKPKKRKQPLTQKPLLKQKLEAGTAVWRKVSGEWMIQVTGQEVNVGDIVEVERKDGSKSKHVISKIATKTEEGTFL